MWGKPLLEQPRATAGLWGCLCLPQVLPLLRVGSWAGDFPGDTGPGGGPSHSADWEPAPRRGLCLPFSPERAAGVVSGAGLLWRWASGRLWAPLLGSGSLPTSPCFFLHVACIYWAPTGCFGAGDVAEGGTQALFLDLHVLGRPLGVPSVARVINFLRPHATRVECMCTPRTYQRK